MRGQLIACTFLFSITATHAQSLPSLSISKRDARLRANDVARGVVKRDGTVQTNVYDVLTWSSGGAYYANITAGTPAQEQIVILDTGSSDLYFDASTAPACQSTGPYSCRGGTFAPKNSSTYTVVASSPAFNTTFGDGSTAVGPFAEDVIGIGDVRVSNVQFGVAEEVNSTTGYAIGLMGLGYSENEATRTEYPNMPEVLRAAGVINSRLYSIYLNDVDSTGTILFGGIDTSKIKGELATINLLPNEDTGEVDQFITTVTDLYATVSGQSNTFFTGGENSISVFTDDTDNVALPVLLDTGSAAWSVPTDLYNNYFAPLFSYVDSDGYCSCDEMNNGDSLTLTFGGKVNVTVPSREFITPLYNSTTNEPYIYSSAGDQACAFMIIASDEESEQGFLTLGDAILRSMYVVFDLDNGQLSIAQAVANSTASPSIVTVAAGTSGVASAFGSSASYTGAPTQSYSIAAEVSQTGTASFVASTAQSTIGAATGEAAVPVDARPDETDSEGSEGTSTKGAAAAMRPGVAWQGWGSAVVVGLGMLVGTGVMVWV